MLTRGNVESPYKFVRFVASLVIAFPMATLGGLPGTNFEVCLAKVNNGTFGLGVDVGGTDNHGYPVNASLATGVTYSLCVHACGSVQEPFQFTNFAQQFSSFLLPWLALVSQLPFGSNDMLENLYSVILTVGSPTLAAYSLILTVLNSRWVTRRFARYPYPNFRNAIRIFRSLQQSPIRLVEDNGLLASLIVLPQNDKWWAELAKGIDCSHRWSISIAASIAWVVIAYIFSVVGSFTAGIANGIHSNGLGVGSLWLWLLPIVIGWLQFQPKSDAALLKSAVERANEQTYIATDDGKTPVPVNKGPNDARAIELTLKEVDDLHRDEKCTSPVFNYARFLPWVQAVEDVTEAFQAASDNFHNHKSVDPSIAWDTVEKGQKPTQRNRMGTRAQVEKYCTLDLAKKPPASGRWRPKVLSRMFLASALALMLQWGTAGAALIQAWYTPTRGENFTVLFPSCLLITVTGLGCRSASYLFYAVLSTIVWMMLVTSSILTHYASTTQYPSEGHAIREGKAKDEERQVKDEERQALLKGKAVRHRSIARRASIILRRLGKIVAAFNSVWAVVVCVCQFGNVFDNCFCNSSVFSLGTERAYAAIAIQDLDFWIVQSAWIGSVFLAGGTVAIYAFVNVLLDPPLPAVEDVFVEPTVDKTVAT
jgi:hypothetical protein